MGVIQNAINQTLGTAGIAARLSPSYETKQELYKLNRQSQILKKQAKSAELRGIEQTSDPDLLRNIGDIKERELNLAKQKFQLDPTKEGFQDIVSKQQGYRRFNQIADILTQKQDQALKKADALKDAKDLQKSRVKNYPEELKKTINLLKGRDMTDDK